MKAKSYRFFYHYRRSIKGMTVHYKGICYPCHNVICEAKTETKWNKTQPQLVLQGFSTGLDLQYDGDSTTIIIKK